MTSYFEEPKTISLDNGLTWKTVAELTDEEIEEIIKNRIPCVQQSEDDPSPENNHWRFSADNASGENNREWLQSFVDFLYDHFKENICIG